MSLKKGIYLVLAAFVLLSCSYGGRKSVSSVAERFSESLRFEGPQAVPMLYSEGLLSVLEGDTAGGVSYFRRALELDSTHAPSWYELAAATADPAEALAYSRRACAMDSANVWYRTLLAQQMIDTEQYDSALRVYNTLLKLSPDNPEIYFRLAALYDFRRQPFTAIALLDSAETRFGKIPQLSGFKQQLLMNAGLYDKALGEANALVASSPYDETNYIVLAEIYAQMGRDSLTRDAYRTALELNPNSVPALISMSEYYRRSGDQTAFLSAARRLILSNDLPEEAKLRFFKELIKSRDYYRDYYFQIGDVISALTIKLPKNFEVTELYAGHLIYGGKIEEALRLYKSHLVTDGIPNRDAFNEVLAIEAYLNRPDSVARYSELALQYYPDDPELYLRKGSVLAYYMKDPEGAEKEYLKALKLADSDSLRSSILGVLGDNRHMMGDEKNSFRYYRKALRKDSTNSVVLNNYSYYLSVLSQDLPRAEKMADAANRLSPDNPTYLDTQAWVYFRLGRFAEAKTLMQKVMALSTDPSEEVLMHYGDILFELGEPFMASYYWKKALENGADPDEVVLRLEKIEKQ